VTPLFPVESVSWRDAAAVLQMQDLVFPTELQWEYAARGGTTTPWWTGTEPETLSGTCNIADVRLALADVRLALADRRLVLSHATNAAGSLVDAELWLDDGLTFTGPVGRFGPNPFGLFDMLGNVAEWCLDVYSSYDLDVVEGRDRRVSTGGFDRVTRGGSYLSTAAEVRSAARAAQHVLLATPQTGIRPARGVLTYSIDWENPNR
jgi:formylglycine-generating enzyme required for sulfatase activity